MLKAIKLPPHVVLARQTSMFNSDTVPKGLLRDHATKAGTWGRLVVQQGVVEFHDQGSSERRQVEAGEHQVIIPEAVHFIEPTGDAVFFVEFYTVETEPDERSNQQQEIS
ncbi:MAG: DUF1971 domain-containing protein [Pseudomonadota bacterium]